jgi:negative regulator of replication initiation
MPTIRIDDVVWQYLQSQAKPFVDTPNDVLRRVLLPPDETTPIKLRPDASPNLERTKLMNKGVEEEDYSGHRVTGYRLDGREVPCRYFKDVLVTLSNELRGSDRTAFDRVALGLRGKKRSYFSKTPDDLKFPLQLTGHGLFVETNLNANLIVDICRDLIQGLGRKRDELVIDSIL